MRLLLHAFPSGFRRRYGDELLELVGAGQSPVRDGANLVLAGLRVRLEELSKHLRPRAGAQALSLGLVAAAALGSVALGGCLILGSMAAGGGGLLALRRIRLLPTPAW
jgi:hypothetical protein